MLRDSKHIDAIETDFLGFQARTLQGSGWEPFHVPDWNLIRFQPGTYTGAVSITVN